MHTAPYDKSPIGAMPDATDKKGHYDVEIVACLAAAVAAKRDIDIVFEPSRKRDVPTVPKFTDSQRKIRSVEVVDKMVA